MNSLIVSYKPPFITSNAFLNRLKKQFNEKKGGFLGTLDPFAQGSLIIGFGSYTKLLPFLQNEPKVYKATLWLGANSPSLDIEEFLEVKDIKKINIEHIKEVFSSLIGEISYVPPVFSAKKINGKRAYALARKATREQLESLESAIKPQIMNLYELELLNYNHPFISFKASVSKGAYIRSLGNIIATRLNASGILSYLQRLSEGTFIAKKNEIIHIEPFNALHLKELHLDENFALLLKNGAKIALKNIRSGIYKVKFSDFFSIIQIDDEGNIHYLLNRIALC